MDAGRVDKSVQMLRDHIAVGEDRNRQPEWMIIRALCHLVIELSVLLEVREGQLEIKKGGDV